MDFRLRLGLALALTCVASACADDTPSTSGTEGDSSSTGGDPTVTMSTTQGMSSTSPTTGEDTTAATDDSTTVESTETTAPPPTSSTSDTETDATTDSSSSSGEGSTTEAVAGCLEGDLGMAVGDNVASGSTIGEGDDYWTQCARPGSPEVMYEWTAPSDGEWLIDLFGSQYATALAVLSPDCNGFELTCGYQSVVVELTAGQTVVIVVDGDWGEAGSYQLNINEAIPGDCCVPSGTPGCDDPTCEDVVCAVEPWCCDNAWDEYCAFELAPQYCAECFPAGDCCLANGTPSCDDDFCAASVCAIDPSCCDTAWTQSCANMAIDTCAACAPGMGQCCAANGSPGCANVACQSIVCSEWDSWCCDVEWDEWCADGADQLCAVCQPLGPCCTGNFSPGCTDPFVQDCVCASMPQCCTNVWTSECAAAVETLGCGACQPLEYGCTEADLGTALGEVATGTNLGQGNDLALPCAAPGGEDVAFTWTSPADGTYQFDTFGTNYDVALAIIHPDCEGAVMQCSGQFMQPAEEVVMQVPGGVTLVVAIDGFGATVGNYVLNINPPPGTGYCCIQNFTPGCSNASCQTEVCAIDPSCCTSWTQQCADLAIDNCSVCQGGAGSCCVPNGTPGCDDLGCTAQVCAIEPWCCDQAWDEWCVELATMECGC